MPENPSSNYYALLGVNPSASVQQIRRAYRELSKLYHPDTTDLPAAVATAKFQQLNEAYANLSSPERRVTYDLKMGYSRVSVIQAPANLNRPVSESRKFRSSAYLDPSDRPLSAGEIFALFILGVTFVACLILVITIGLTRGDSAFEPLAASSKIQAVESSQASSSDLQAPVLESSLEPFPSSFQELEADFETAPDSMSAPQEPSLYEE